MRWLLLLALTVLACGSPSGDDMRESSRFFDRRCCPFGRRPLTPPVQAWNPSQISSGLFEWGLADDYSGPGEGASVPDLGDNSGNRRRHQESTASRIPTYSSTAVGGRPGILSDGTDRMPSTLAPSAWTFLHDGSGATVAISYQASGTGTIFDTAINPSVAASLRHGITLAHDATNQRVTLTARNANVAVVNFSSANDSAPNGAPHTVLVTLAAGAWALWIDGALAGSGVPGTLASADPPSTLHLFSRVDSTTNLAGAIRAWSFWNRVLDAEEITAVNANLFSATTTRTQRRVLWVIGHSFIQNTGIRKRIRVRALENPALNVAWVGTEVTGTGPTFPDSRHEGVAGAKFNDTAPRVVAALDGLQESPTDRVYLIGLNDCNPDHYIDQATEAAEYDAVVQAAQASGASDDWMCNIAYSRRDGVEDPVDYLSNIQDLNPALPAVATARSATLVDIYAATAADPTTYISAPPDGLHPTSAGDVLIGDLIADALGI